MDPSSATTRSDIYSLAVSIWELLAGSRPFGDTPRSGSADLPPLEALVLGIGDEAAGRIHLALSEMTITDPSKRLDTTASLRRALDAAIQMHESEVPEESAKTHPLHLAH